MNLNLTKRNYFVIPVIMSLIIVLIVTLSNRFPLGWDIYTHINYSLAYLHNGITNVDYLLNAPAGKTIGYPPFFHIILIIVSFISNTNLIDAARILQVILFACNIFVVCLIATEFYDENVGFFSGILLMSSFMVTRLFLPIPETVAVIFFMFAVLCYYKALTELNYKYSILTSVFSLLTLFTHFSTFIYLMGLLFVLMIVNTIILRNFNAIEYYVYVIIPIFFISLFALVVLFLLNTSILTQIISGVISILNNPFDLFMGQVAMGLERYVKCIGLVSLIFSIVGLYFSFKNREYLFVSFWALTAFIFSNLHWFGIPVYTFRLLIYLLIPMALLGGYGFSKLLDTLKDKSLKDNTLNVRKILVLLLIIVSVLLCLVHINDSSISTYSSVTEQSTYQIAPPTSDEIELINFLNNEPKENKSVLINNLFLGTVISSMDEIPIHYGFDVYTNKSLSKSSLDSLNKEQIGYIVYDKSLIMNNTSDYERLDVKYIPGNYYPSYYFTKEITDNNFNEIRLQSSEKVFENDRFIVCKIS